MHVTCCHALRALPWLPLPCFRPGSSSTLLSLLSPTHPPPPPHPPPHTHAPAGHCSLRNLKRLSLQNNRIEHIEGLTELKQLEELYLSHNGITQLTVRKGGQGGRNGGGGEEGEGSRTADRHAAQICCAEPTGVGLLDCSGPGRLWRHSLLPGTSLSPTAPPLPSPGTACRVWRLWASCGCWTCR